MIRTCGLLYNIKYNDISIYMNFSLFVDVLNYYYILLYIKSFALNSFFLLFCLLFKFSLISYIHLYLS